MPRAHDGGAGGPHSGASATIRHPSSDRNAQWELWHPGRRLRPGCSPRLSQALHPGSWLARGPSYRPRNALPPKDSATALCGLVWSPASSAKEEPCLLEPRVISADFSPACVPHSGPTTQPQPLWAAVQSTAWPWKWAAATLQPVSEQVCWPRVPMENARNQCP